MNIVYIFVKITFMERLFLYEFRDQDILETYLTTPEKFIESFSSLGEYPNVDLKRVIVPESSPQVLSNLMHDMQLKMGQIPLAMSICNEGIYRSLLIARFLKQEGLAELSKSNYDTKTLELTGCGSDYLDLIGLGFTDEGVSGHYQEPRPADVLLLNFAIMRQHRSGDARTFAQLMLLLNQGLSEVQLKRNLSIIWLEGTEDDFSKWFPES